MPRDIFTSYNLVGCSLALHSLGLHSLILQSLGLHSLILHSGFALFAQGHRLTQCSLSLQIQTITVKNQEFGLSREEPTQPFYYAQFDGIMGMAYPALAAGGTPTPLQGMLEQNQLKQPIFSFYFSR